MKRWTSLLVIFCLTLGFFPASARAWGATEEFLYSIENTSIVLKYEKSEYADGSGSIRITGYEGEASTVSGYLEIPSEIEGYPVTSIGAAGGYYIAASFSDCLNLQSFVIPESVSRVLLDLSGCSNLESIHFPQSVGGTDFIFSAKNCTSLKSIRIPDGVNEIAAETFLGCTSLESVYLPDSVTLIGGNNSSVFGVKGAFEDCTSLVDVRLPDGLEAIESRAFCNCTSLQEITIPASVNRIGGDRFGSYSYGSLDDVGGVFMNCTSLKSIIIPQNITVIPHNAFKNCSSLESVILQGSISTIYTNAFMGCSSLSSISLPETLSSIGDEAFSQCATLKYITIPSNVEKIGFRAFQNCINLENIILFPTTVEIDRWAFSGCEKIVSAGPIGGDYNLQFAWTTEIPAHALGECEYVKSVELPNSIQSVDSYAFYGCSGLVNITIPDSVISVGGFAFYGCSGLTDVYYSGSVEQWEAISFEDYNTYLTDATIHYNSTGPDDVPFEGGVAFLSGYDDTTRQVTFGYSGIVPLDIYTVADNVDVSNISELVNKYVLVTAEQGDSILEYTITDIQPVESAIGTVSATGEHSLTIAGTEYPVREDYVLGTYDGQEILYHIYDGTIVGFTALEEKTGTLEAWDSTTGQATINFEGSEITYLTNYLSDRDFLDNNATWLTGLDIRYTLADGMVLRVAFMPNLELLPNPWVEQVGKTFDLIASGTFTLDPTLTESDIHWTVKDESILTILNTTCDSAPPSVTLRANRAGTTIVTCSVDGVGEANCEVRVELDRWYFTNSNTQNSGQWPADGGYYISLEDYFRLISNLNPIDMDKISFDGFTSRFNVTVGGVQLLSPWFEEWTGSCYGMSSWVCLTASGALLPELVNSESLYAIQKLSLETQSVINYYQNQQYLSSTISQMNSFMSLTQSEQLEKLKTYAEAANNGENPMLICFQWYNEFEDDGKCKTSDPSGHAVVGYGLEDGNWSITVNGQLAVYTHRVIIYDCARSTSGNFADYDLYFNDSGTWCIPAWSIISTDNGVSNRTNNGRFKLVTNDVSVINAVDYTTGNTNWVPSSQITTLSAPANKVYTIANAGGSYTISGFSVLESTRNESLNIIIEDNITADGESVPSTATVVLPDAESSYTVTSGDSFMNFSLTYENYLETAVMNSSGSIEFLANGTISLSESEKTDYYVSITANDGYYSLPWYTIAATGSDSTNVSMELVDDGVILNGDNLNEVTVYGTNDKETKELTFSTDENSVLITDKDNELVILADIDNDGEYETLIEEVSSKAAHTITFNANGGMVGITTMTTGTDGKLSSLPTPTRNGYTFDGWYTAASGGTQVTTGTVFNADTTVYAHWTFVESDSPSIPPSAPSNGSASYSISVPSDVDNGSVTVSPKSAAEGDVVTVTVTPDEGYELEELTVTARNGRELKLTDKGDGRYTFIMPDSKVTISASFSPIPSASQPGLDLDNLENWIGPFAAAAAAANAKLPFADVAESAWYYDAVRYVYQKGLMGGSGSAETFQPDQITTRAMLVTILYRLEGEPSVTETSAYTDVPAGQYYTDAVAWATRNQIVTGYDGAFHPDDPLTRQDMATILYRYASYKGHNVSARAGLSAYTDAGQVSSYAADAMSWANAAGLITGLPNNLLAPLGDADRATVATILTRFCENVV